MKKKSTEAIRRNGFSLQRKTKVGLYDPNLEKDSCGVAMLANLKGKQSHQIVKDSNKMLSRMHHRGGCGAEPSTGDGAGILLGMPDKFYRKVASKVLSIQLPSLGNYACGVVFMSHEQDAQKQCRQIVERVAPELGLRVLGWRHMPTNSIGLGKSALISEPYIENLFIENTANHDSNTLERQLLLLRKRTDKEISSLGFKDWYVCSLSSRTVTYKGQLTSAQLPSFYVDLIDPTFETHMAMVHSRFSTNTFPSWDRAQPCRMLCHNGEINTLRGNKSWMKARSGIMSSPILGDTLSKDLFPINSDDMTDSGNVDAVVEVISKASDRSIVETMLMLIPEAWQNDAFANDQKRAFYEYNSYLMEPWDGPAMMAFTDGRYLGAVLDRNGLRPSRFYVTTDDHVLLSSEVGVLPDLPVENVALKGRLEPGKVFLIDLIEGRIVRDEEVKSSVSSSRPYREWLKAHSSSLEDWVVSTSKQPIKNVVSTNDNDSAQELLRRMHAHGYTTETLDLLMIPMTHGKEALGSMGVDAPLAVLSDYPKQVSEYFKQLFAQVTNPPIDPIREEIVMTLECPVGPEGNLLSIDASHAQRLVVKDPILTYETMDAIKSCNSSERSYKGLWWTKILDATFPRGSGGQGLVEALKRLSSQASEAIREQRVPILVISHDQVSANNVAIPSLLAVGVIHQHLISEQLRTRSSLFVDCGDAREVHDFCTLIGYGADAVCPRVAYKAVESLFRAHKISGVHELDTALYNYRKSCSKGILKVMSKMGISTLQSYKAAQIFECVGLHEEVVDMCFSGTNSRLSGIGFDVLAKDAETCHERGYPISLISSVPFVTSNAENALTHTESTRVNSHPHGQLHDPPPSLVNPGDYHYRHGGEKHLNDPASMSALQVAARTNSRSAYTKYSKMTTDLSRKVSLRGHMELDMHSSPSIPLEEVEPVANILRRFVTGAMSLGSISAETHESLAIAMNRLGARSNTGEGGEDPVRFITLPNGDSKRSAIKQVASGRFGVTSHYLANADQIQIKMAQGAKPGEGGELPGYKVSKEIARVRGTTPGVGLISPPPHHDIYSIEDLAQLIHDLKNANPQASVSVKLVSEVGVGVVAAGCAKAKADHIVVSGGDGGTGAAAWTGIHRAGLPWELGIAEAQQTLVLNDLRSRVVLQADGQIKTGRDVVIAALLGAEEFGFSTAPLIALGCIMMRKCHLNTCPVGIATQDPVLRAKFEGMPEHVMNYLFLLAEEVREYMGGMGFRTFDEMIGRTDKLKHSMNFTNYKSSSLNFDAMLYPGSELNPEAIPRHILNQDHELEVALDNKFISRAKESLETGAPVSMEFSISNINRSVGAMLSYQVSKAYGKEGLPLDTIRIKLNGSAGQSLGFSLAKGISIDLEGDANDSVGKALSGGRIVVYPPQEQLDRGFVSENNVIIGNVALYGATSGEAFFRGRAGERFAVRNSGANTVVEGLGDHGCEYMTGGNVVVLGETGRNFAAGMSGGIAFVHDPSKRFPDRCNQEMVGLSKVEHPEDKEMLLSLIEKHVRMTGSPQGRAILSNWPDSLEDFVQITPHDFAKVRFKNDS